MFCLSATAPFLIRKFLFFWQICLFQAGSRKEKKGKEKRRKEKKRKEKDRKGNDTKVFAMESLGRYNIQKLGNSYDNTQILHKKFCKGADCDSFLCGKFELYNEEWSEPKWNI